MSLSGEEQDAIYQSVVGSKPNYVYGRGYMTKPPTSAKRVRDEVNYEIQGLKRQLEVEQGRQNMQQIVLRVMHD